MTNAQYFDQVRSETRVRQDSAAIVGGLRSGELRRTPAERFDILVARMRAHRDAGRLQAARACARMAKRMWARVEAGE